MISNKKKINASNKVGKKGHNGVWKGHEKAFGVGMEKSNWQKGRLENWRTNPMKVGCFFMHKITPVCYKVTYY